MIKMYKQLLIFFFVFGCVSDNALAKGMVCHSDKRVVAACFEVQGTLTVRANLRAVLRDSNTGRYFVLAFESDSPDSRYLMPEALFAQLSPDHDVAGRFVVCPFSKKKKGYNQTVCISEMLEDGI